VGDALKLLAMGANRLVVGTLAYSSPPALRDLVETAGADSVVVAADFKDGRIVTHGWTQGATMGLPEAAKYIQDFGVRTLLVTDVERDGTATGPDLETYGSLRKETKQTILASGGIRSEHDIESLARLGIEGVILGKGLYDGSIKLRDADGGSP
jgi:phosphoribosylformimino-5-aminoimidazole carboxamide ribotide isomerase